ncbi:MAG: class I SAM-dependent methyltransferase [Planctomycetota bacterium]
MKEFYAFHLFVVSLILASNKLINEFLGRFTDPSITSYLTWLSIVVTLTIVMIFYKKIGFGFLKSKKLRARLLGIEERFDPAGEYFFVLLDDRNFRIIGYAIIEIRLEGADYVTKIVFRDRSHNPSGYAVQKSFVLQKEGDNKNNPSINASFLIYLKAEGFKPLVASLDIYQTEGMAQGFMMIQRINNQLTLRGVESSGFSRLPPEKQRKSAEKYISTYSGNHLNSTYEMFLSNSSIRETYFSSMGDPKPIELGSSEYADAWMQWIGGVEGSDERNRLFASFSEFISDHELVSDVSDDSKISVLDLGCGNGIAAQFLQRVVGPIDKYYGVDCCGKLLNYLHQVKLPHVVGISADLRIHDEFEKISPISSDIDLILASRLLNHLNPKETSKLLKFISQRMPASLLIIINPYRANEAAIHDESLSKLGSDASIEEILNGPDGVMAWNGVKHPGFPRSPHSYELAIQKLGYTNTWQKSFTIHGQTSKPSHFMVIATKR